jgi:erythromycin esterase
MIRTCTALLLICFAATSLQAQWPSPEVAKSIRNQAFDIKVDNNYSGGDWEPLLTAIGGRRIVMLGEFTHGAREIFKTRTSIIKELYKRGYDVILFESGVGEVGFIDVERNQLSAVEMTGGFFGAWRNEACSELMTFIKNNHISIGGIDVQRTGKNFGPFLEAYLTRHRLMRPQFVKIEDRFGTVNQKLTTNHVVYDSVSSVVLKLITDYDALAIAIKADMDMTDPVTQLIAKTVDNRIRYLEYRLKFVEDKDLNARWQARDEAMYDNLMWHIDTKFPGSKVVVVTHNFHVSKSNDSEETMGEILNSYYPNDSYSIGVFAGGGVYSDNSGRAVPMSTPDETQHDIQHVIHTVGKKVSFIDFPESWTASYQWANDEIVVNDSFTDLNGTNQLRLSASFDGILLIDKVSPSK